jgi:hypothetical protein
VQSGVVFNVNITGTPTVNIQTSGGANIVIDKLTQGAYTERQAVLANNGATPIMFNPGSTTYYGKFFPRGARGFIRAVYVYCSNADTASHAFTIYLSPMPGMGAVASFTLTVPAGAGSDWRSVTVGRFWNYDSLFVWLIADSPSYPRLGYDAGAPYDEYYSGDGASWSFATARLWIQISYSGLTVGDLPVSGTVNTVEVPGIASFLQGSLVNVPSNTETSMLTFYGSGTVLEIRVLIGANTPPSASVSYAIRVYVDGEFAGVWSNIVLTQSETATSGRCQVGIFAQYTGTTVMALWVPFRFRRSLEVRFYQTTGSSVNCYACVLVNRVT